MNSSDSSPSSQALFTVGHSNHELPVFLELLQAHDIKAIADVRSHPYSRQNPQFNRESIQGALDARGIEYGFFGIQLGARRTEPEAYVDGKAEYGLIAESEAFQYGLEKLRESVETYRIALMCAEKDPLTCHRCILIGRHLRDEFDIYHIDSDGEIETHTQAEDRLLELLKMPTQDLFQSREDLVEQAYDIQGDKIAYVRTESVENPEDGLPGREGGL